jgi:hypothetical protein
MYLSVSIKQTDDGYVPQLVFENPKIITVYPVGKPCSTFMEAWIVARAVAKDRTRRFSQDGHA